MNPTQLKASLRLWESRARYRKARHARAERRGDRNGVLKWGPKLEESRQMVARRRMQIADHPGIAPPIITAAQLGLTFQWVFGQRGTPTRRTGHYTAGPRARNAAAGIAIVRGLHRQHAGQGWGGGSYDAVICDDGTLILVNPPLRKSAHVAMNNTGNAAINCPGTTGDKPTREQEATYRWYVRNAHTRKVPKAHRQPVDLRKLTRYGHSDLNATACPGAFKPMFKES